MRAQSRGLTAPPREVILAISSVAIFLGLLWSLDLFFLRISVLTPLGEQPALSPIYAFLEPSLRWTALAFPAVCIALLYRLPVLLQSELTSKRSFGLHLLVASLLLPLSLFLVREPLSRLGSLLATYPGEEIYYDALGIQNLSAFYLHYVDWIPQLSLHGQHFPPGLATFHYWTFLVFGDSFLAAAIAIAILFCAGIFCAYRALCTHLGEERGRQAILLCLASPSLIDFAFTSTDAVFFAAASLSLWLSLLALGSPARYWLAILAGAALFAATVVSYSAFPMGLAILLMGLLRCRLEGHRPLIALAVMGASFVVLVAVLGWGTGFSLPEHFLAAHENNTRLMTEVIGSNPSEHYALISYGNAAAFLIGLGVAVGAALFVRVRAGSFPFDPFRLAVLCTLAILAFGNLHQMETERIWIYAVPWLAALALDRETLVSAALPWLLVVGWLQAYLMEIFLFTLW